MSLKEDFERQREAHCYTLRKCAQAETRVRELELEVQKLRTIDRGDAGRWASGEQMDFWKARAEKAERMLAIIEAALEAKGKL